ncbi:hypothetical protein F4780DRAFT_780719 [Xylariomycetidae sp. FL0641]|nr:hypothetical protein F4780DRAFT_780719 [Xylariomycetidae sp. FL0641]
MASARLDTSDITQWRSILTLVVFMVINSLIVIFPFHIPFYFPRKVHRAVLGVLINLRVISPQPKPVKTVSVGFALVTFALVRFDLPIGLKTAPLGGVLFLLATTAIGRQEVKDGTIGANNILPLDIVAFTLTMGYIISSIDAAGLIRYLSLQLLKRTGRIPGQRLFFYLYLISFGVGCLFGNDAVIQMGAVFLSYFTRVASNILHPRAWIHTNFAIANIASVIFVSSGTTNVVIAQTFKIGFTEYTANVIVPVLLAVLILPFWLLYIVFADESLVPIVIRAHEVPEMLEQRAPINPHIPSAGRKHDPDIASEEHGLPSLEEIMNPFLDKASALTGILIMVSALIVLFVLTAAGLNNIPVYWVTLPAAFIKFCWDLVFGWLHRHETRQIARRAALSLEPLDQRGMYKQSSGDERKTPASTRSEGLAGNMVRSRSLPCHPDDRGLRVNIDMGRPWSSSPVLVVPDAEKINIKTQEIAAAQDYNPEGRGSLAPPPQVRHTPNNEDRPRTRDDAFPSSRTVLGDQFVKKHTKAPPQSTSRPTLVSTLADSRRWARETFPMAAALIERLPFSILLFAIPTFILIQALVSTGWVAVFARWWDAWAGKTGTVGAVAGAGLLSVVLSNIAGTNVGATVLFSRILQDWAELHTGEGTTPLSGRTFWGAVYALAIGVNYAAFSTTFGASLAGIGWRRDLRDKNIQVRSLEFARVNLPLIIFTMAISCAALVGEVYIVRGDAPYIAR